MGRPMTWRDQRTGVALALTVLALAVPCVAWYLVGSREADRQATELTDTAQRAAHDTAVRLATQLTQRLNTLRDTEARRPFYHYQPFYHDPKGASEGASVTLSPLASAPSDPLVLVYFQADGASGRVTLPAEDPEVLRQQAEVALPTQRDTLHYLRNELERGIASILFNVRGESKPVAQQKAAPQGQQVLVLDKRSWTLNADATELYGNIKRRSVAQQQADVAQLASPQEQGNVQIFVGALKWRTL